MSDNIDFNIREFDMNQIGDSKIIIFIGKRNSGKSVLVVDYLYHNQDLPMGTCISATDEYNQTFKGIIPDMFIHDEYSSELIDKVVYRQKWITRKGNDDREYADVDHRAFLIFDDLAFDNSRWINDPNIKFIFMNGRHVGITFLITMQYLLGIPPSLRTNVDYIFLCRETKITMKKKLYEHYAGMFPDFQMFCQVLDECTKDFGCLVIDNVTKSDKLEDQVFWYKADISKHKNFRLCDEVFWSVPEKKEIMDDPAGEDYEAHSRRRGGPGTRTSRSKVKWNVKRLREHEEQDFDYYY